MIWIVKKLVLSLLFIVLNVAVLSSVSDSRRLAGTNLQWTWPSPRITVSDAFFACQLGGALALQVFRTKSKS